MPALAHELRQQKRALTAKASELNNSVEIQHKRGLNAEEQAQFDKIMADADAFDPRIANAERVEGAEAAVIPSTRDLSTTHNYSVVKAIRQLVDQREGNGRVDGMELEMSQEIARRRGKNPEGIFISLNIPTDANQDGAPVGGRISKRALTTTTAAGGIATTLLPDVIDVLRNRLLVGRLGARILTDLVGPVGIPRLSGGGSQAYWLPELGSIPAGTGTSLGQVTIRPRTVGCYTDISRLLYKQTSIDVENMARDDLSAILATGIDFAALASDGTSNKPLGILGDPDVPTIPLGANGGQVTWSTLVDMETAVATANADLGSLAYLASVRLRGKLKKSLIDANNTVSGHLWDTSNELNGYPAYATNQMPDNLVKGSGTNLGSLIFGNWNDLIVGYWGGVDIRVDNITNGLAGGTRLIAFQEADVARRHPESFSKVVDAITT